MDGEFGPLTEAAVVQALGQFLNQQEALVKLARAIDWGTFGAGYTDNNAADGGAGDPQAHLRPEPLSFVPLHTMRSPITGNRDPANGLPVAHASPGDGCDPDHTYGMGCDIHWSHKSGRWGEVSWNC